MKAGMLMKIVYVGRCDSLASKLVDRMAKEENDIYIISEKDFIHEIKPALPYKLYAYKSDSVGIQKVFASICPEIVIFAGDVYLNEIWEQTKETNTYLSELLNVLNSSVLNYTEKFIYLSSQEVYCPQSGTLLEESKTSPTTYKGLLCFQGESMVRNFGDMYKLDYVILRTSDIYGCSINEGCKDFTTKILNGFYSDGEFVANKGKVMFPLYIKDVVESIFRSKDVTPSDVYNVSGNEITNEFEVACLLNNALEWKFNVKETEKSENVFNLDNSKIKRELEWFQFHTLQDVIFDGEFNLKKAPEKPSKLEAVHRQSAFMQSLENVLVFCFFIFLTFLCQSHSALRSMDLFYIYIILMSLMFGVRQSILSVMLSSAFYILHSGINVTSIVDILINVSSILKIAEYIFMGVVVGYSVDQYRAVLQERKVEYDYLEGEYNEIKEINDDNVAIKQEYERRLISYKTSLPKLYSIISELTVLEPEKIFAAIVKVVKDVMDTDTVAVYMLNSKSSYARLMVSLNEKSIFQGKSFNLDNFSKLRDTLYENEIFVGSQWDENEPSLAAPIFHKGQCIAIIVINEMPFKALNLYQMNLFRTLSVLITSSIVKANAYEEAVRDGKYIDQTDILISSEFKKLVNIREEERKQGLSDYCLLKVECNSDILGVYEKIYNMLRNTDSFGVTEQNELMVLLGNTQEKDAEYVLKRFKDRGINASIVGWGTV